MTVDKLDENRVLVVLCSKDMDELKLDYSTMSLDNIHSRNVLMHILKTACSQSGIALNGKSIQLEAIKLDDGCYILITVNHEERQKTFGSGKFRKSKTYKLKTAKASLCYCLGGSDDFLNAIELLYRQNIYCNKNSAYLYNNEYYLIFDYPSVPEKLSGILLEYGTKKSGRAFAARIKEAGKELCRYNAIARIGKYLV